MHLEWGDKECLLIDGSQPIFASKLVKQKKEQCVAQGPRAPQSACLPASPEVRSEALNPNGVSVFESSSINTRVALGVDSLLCVFSPDRVVVRIWGLSQCKCSEPG